MIRIYRVKLPVVEVLVKSHEDAKIFKAEVFVKSKMNVESGSLELVSGVTLGDISSELSRKMVELEEQAIVETLIESGWTPPPKE